MLVDNTHPLSLELPLSMKPGHGSKRKRDSEKVSDITKETFKNKQKQSQPSKKRPKIESIFTQVEDDLITTDMRNKIDNSISILSKNSKKRWNRDTTSILIKAMVEFNENWPLIVDFLKTNGIIRTERQVKDKFKFFSDKERKEYGKLLDEKKSKVKKESLKVKQQAGQHDKSEDQIMKPLPKPPLPKSGTSVAVPAEKFNQPESSRIGYLAPPEEQYVDGFGTFAEEFLITGVL